MVQVKIMKAISERNDDIAREIRAELGKRGIKAINIISSPGSGKTTLIEKTVEHLKGVLNFGVIVGDLFTPLDAERLEKASARSFQLNTEGSCHLTAPMVSAALSEFDVSGIDLLFIENIGNLICPSTWNLGETNRVTLLSVTEGSDKVVKYRPAFYAADTVVITKLDLLPSCDFDAERVTADIRALNPSATVLKLSAKTGEGMPAWFEYIRGLQKVSKTK